MAKLESVERDSIIEWIWESVDAREGPWRTPVLATVDNDLGADARTIVLRDADPDARSVYFYTARDSDKVRQFTRDSRCCMVVYDAEARRQVRMYGRGEPVMDQGWLEKAWQKLADWQQQVYALQRRIRGKENFAAYRVRIDAMHYLELHADGSNRAIELRLANENAAGNSGGAWLARVVEP
ncbi:MAG: pyridoxamine 5'-phosphate oxidase family protein [Gammaproteobacteria bacterium]|nr:pyridoxamine 5'-phosphate oxidase family protein [Gammaproteobacteria bacterium]